MLPTEVSTKIKPIDAKTISGTDITHFHDEKKPLNHRIGRNEDPTPGPYAHIVRKRKAWYWRSCLWRTCFSH